MPPSTPDRTRITQLLSLAQRYVEETITKNKKEISSSVRLPDRLLPDATLDARLEVARELLRATQEHQASSSSIHVSEATKTFVFSFSNFFKQIYQYFQSFNYCLDGFFLVTRGIAGTGSIVPRRRGAFEPARGDGRCAQATSPGCHSSHCFVGGEITIFYRFYR